jgi:aminoglycoside 3-N-acetyltransferase
MAQTRARAGPIDFMQTATYHLLRRFVSQQARDRMKRSLLATRTRIRPVYRRLYGTFRAADLVDEVWRHIDPGFEILMVHCSYNDLLPMYDGDVAALLRELVARCDGRTLAMPAFFGGGRERDVVAYYRANPVFDVRRQPSEMGLLSELFRRRKGVSRSLHPTHSVCALGPLADELTTGHHLCPTTFGEGTPFGAMTKHRTVIVGLGTWYFRSLTQVHAAEDMLGDRFPAPKSVEAVQVTLVATDGSRHPYLLRYSRYHLTRRTEYLGALLHPPDLTQWTWRGAPIYQTTASRVTDALTGAAQRGETIYRR